MTVIASALRFKRLVDEHTTLSMLRAERLPIIAAALGEYLGTPGTRILADDLHEIIDGDLEVLRDHFDLGGKTAKAYCADWRESGILIRRPAVEARGETYELSAAAFEVLRLLEQLDAPRSSVTESRLASLAKAIRQLTIDTDPDVTRRVQALEVERDRITAEIERLTSADGEDASTLDDRQARERVHEVLMLAQDLPADFARVRARFEQINHDLRTSLLSHEGTQSAVLDDIFRGVDVIAESEEGQTYAGFASLLRDAERQEGLESDVASILDREFAGHLEPASRKTLRRLVSDMKNASRDVSGSLTEFYRGLRSYVHSQDFQRDRVLRILIQESLSAAVKARPAVKPYTDLGLEIEISAMQITSAGEVTPRDPSEYDTGELLEDAEEQTADYAELARIARESEIDYVELIANVNTLIDTLGRASVGVVLAHRPATQGLASVVGLMSLATSHGMIHDDTEVVTWEGPFGRRRRMEIRRHEFTERVGL